MKFKNDSGRSMFEMVLYLGLIVLLTASTIKMYSESVEKTRLVTAENQIDDLKEKVNIYYMGREFPATGNIQSNLKSKLGDQININDPWGSTVEIYANKTGVSGDAVLGRPFFSVKFQNLTKDRCIKVASLFVQKDPVAVGVNVEPMTAKTVLNVSEIVAKCSKDEPSNTAFGTFIKE